MFPILQVGSLAIQVPGLILLIGVWVGLSLAERFATRWNVQPNQLSNLIMIGLIAGILGARITYIVRYPGYFFENPLSALSLNPGLLDFSGGIVIALTGMLIYAQRKNMNLWATLDALTPFFAVLGVAIGLSHISSGSAYGIQTDVAWGIELWGAKRHPTQIYETVFAFLILVAVWPGWRIWADLRAGIYTLIFIALSAISALLVEAYRADSSLVAGGLRTNQLIAWMILLMCLWGIYMLNKGKSEKELASEESR